MEQMIKTEKLSFAYVNQFDRLEIPVLHEVSLTIPAGQFVTVLGRNGSGKSTLARHFNAINLPSGGTVWIDGRNTADPKQLMNIRRACSMVFQNPDNQIVSTVVEEDVAFALENMGLPSWQIRNRVDDALKAVDLYEYRRHAPHLLSGGQKQRVAIAGVLAMEPRCIVLDEPTAMLDPQGRAEVMRILHRLHAQGITIVLITHHMDEAVQAQRVVVLDQGRIVLDGAPRDVFTETGTLYALGLDVPQTVEILQEINEQAHMRLPIGALSVEQCADWLERWLRGGANA